MSKIIRLYYPCIFVQIKIAFPLLMIIFYLYYLLPQKYKKYLLTLFLLYRKNSKDIINSLFILII